MSKLSKFKGYLGFVEAADLLSRLIDEPVTIDDLLDLHDNDWLPLFRPGAFELVPLVPAYSPEEHAEHVDDGRIFMTPVEGGLVICNGFHHPCSVVYVDRVRVWALQNAKGQYFALRPIDSVDLLSPYGDAEPEMEEMLIEPRDIYWFAEMANDEEPEPTKPTLLREAPCIGLEAEPVFNLPVDVQETKGAKPGQDKYSEGNKPSVLLAVSALLELAKEPRVEKRNAAGIINDIVQRHPEWRLSESTLQKMFADSNRTARAQGLSPKRRKKM